MEKRRRFKVDKLVRDKTLERMLAKGVISVHHVMDNDEYSVRLKDKLLEEAHEVNASKSVDEYRAEFADLLEVIHAFAGMVGLSYDQIEQERLHRRAERGGFEGRIYQEYVEVDPDSEVAEYLNRDPDKYPEID